MDDRIGLTDIERLARATLRDRGIAVVEMEKALANGKRKDAISWGSEIRKLDKLIAQYGLDRYVQGT